MKKEPQVVYNGSCIYSSQCTSNYYCMSGRCLCASGYYYTNGSCRMSCLKFKI